MQFAYTYAYTYFFTSRATGTHQKHRLRTTNTVDEEQLGNEVCNIT